MSNRALTVFSENTAEYHRLLATAHLITAETKKACKVDTIYFDAGQNWLYTTISIESELKCFPWIRALDPKQQDTIVYGTLDEWYATVQELIQKHIS